MRKIIIILLFTFFSVSLHSQTKINNDTAKFSKNVTALIYKDLISYDSLKKEDSILCINYIDCKKTIREQDSVISRKNNQLNELNQTVYSYSLKEKVYQNQIKVLKKTNKSKVIWNRVLEVVVIALTTAYVVK